MWGAKPPSWGNFCGYIACSPPKTPHSRRVPLGCLVISVTLISKTSDFHQKWSSDSFKTHQNLSEKYTVDPVGIIVLFCIFTEILCWEWHQPSNSLTATCIFKSIRPTSDSWVILWWVWLLATTLAAGRSTLLRWPVKSSTNRHESHH